MHRYSTTDGNLSIHAQFVSEESDRLWTSESIISYFCRSEIMKTSPLIPCFPCPEDGASIPDRSERRKQYFTHRVYLSPRPDKVKTQSESEKSRIPKHVKKKGQNPNDILDFFWDLRTGYDVHEFYAFPLLFSISYF